MSQHDAIELRAVPPSPIHSPRVGSPVGDSIEPFKIPKRVTYLSNLLSVLRTTHKYSAYTFTAFSLVHFLNTGAAPLLSTVDNLTFANENLTAARALYQNSYLSEAVLVFGSLGVHVASGVIIRLIRIAREYVWYKDHARIPKLSWNSLTGYVILPFATGHIIANRITPWLLDIDITSSSVGHFVTRNPWLGWSFYSVFVSISALHIANGLGQLLGWKKRTRYYVNSIFSTIWLAGLAKVAAHGLETGMKGRQYDLINSRILDALRTVRLA